MRVTPSTLTLSAAGGICVVALVALPTRQETTRSHGSLPASSVQEAPSSRARVRAELELHTHVRDPFSQHELRATTTPTRAHEPTAVKSDKLPPSAPQLLVTYIGRVVTQRHGEVDLVELDGRVYRAVAGEPLDDDYVVEQVTASAITLKHKPTGTTQVLATHPE